MEEDPRKNPDRFKTGLTIAQAAALADQAKAAINAGEDPPPEVTGGPSASAPGEDQEQT